MARKRTDLQKALCRGLIPVPKKAVSVWADEYRTLSQGVSAEPGRWKTSRAPYQKDIMDAFTMPNVHVVVVKSSAQVGKSDIMNNVIGRFAQLDPCPIMMIQPTVDLAEDYSKSRIAPMIRDTKSLNKLFYNIKSNGPKSRDANNTILSKIFPGGRLIMCGANSPSQLASKPIRILLCDEVDRFPVSAGSEGDPVSLAQKRMTTFWNHCMGLFSTPTLEPTPDGGGSRIEKEYINGTQEEWQHKCPNCGEYHTLRHVDMETEYREIEDAIGRKSIIVDSVKYRCPDCGFLFSEKEMRNAEQKYVPQNPEAIKNGIRSFFVNGFTSPWVPWDKIMREWLSAKGDPELEKVVTNTRFGECYRGKGTFDDEMVFVRRREEYSDDLPDGVLLLTASVDTQDNRFEYEVCGWGVDEECWGIEKGEIFGRPDSQATLDKLSEVLNKVYYFANGNGLKISRSFIDSGGHYTGTIYKYCEENMRKQVFAIKGKGGPGIPLVYKVAKATGTKAPVIMLGVDDGKQQVMDRLGIDKYGPKFFHFPVNDDKGYTQVYFKGLISERKKVVKRNGQIREVWETISKGIRNEPLDLRVYNLAAMKSLRPDWEQLYNNLHEIKAEKPVKTIKKKTLQAPKRAQRDFW